MSERSTFRYHGAICLTPGVDGIGIPVFSHGRENMLYVAETAADYSVSRFLKFQDAERYFIDARLAMMPLPDCDVGDPLFIPYWSLGQLGTVCSDATALDLSTLTPVPSGPVAEDIRKILQAGARRRGNGRLLALPRYADDTDLEPTNTKYWVSKFRTLLAVGGDAHAAASAWMAKYFFKGDFRHVISIIDAMRERDGTGSGWRVLAFFQLAERALRKRGSKTKEAHLLHLSQRYFPEGLLRYWNDHQEEIRLELRHHPTLIPKDASFSYDEEILRFQYMINESDAKSNPNDMLFKSALLFGNSDIPANIRDNMKYLYLALRNEIEEMITNVYKRIIEEKSSLDQAIMAETALRRIDSFEIIFRTYHPEYRFSPPDVERLNLMSHEVNFFRTVREGWRFFEDDFSEPR